MTRNEIKVYITDENRLILGDLTSAFPILKERKVTSGILTLQLNLNYVNYYTPTARLPEGLIDGKFKIMSSTGIVRLVRECFTGVRSHHYLDIFKSRTRSYPVRLTEVGTINMSQLLQCLQVLLLSCELSAIKGRVVRGCIYFLENRCD